MSDRGMKKWAPYKSLKEQWDTLDNIHKEEQVERKPQISNEVAEEINDILVNYHGQELEFKYYKSKRIIYEKSTIKTIDALNKKLILANGTTIPLGDLLGLK